MDLQPKVDAALRKQRLKYAVEHIKGMANDALVNTTTGAGTSSSKLYGAYFAAESLLDWTELKALYRFSDLARRLIEKPVDDALKKGFQLERAGKSVAEYGDDARAIQNRLTELRKDRLAQDNLALAVINARLSGGGGLIVGASGGGAMSTNMQAEKIQKIQYVRPFHRHQMTTLKFDRNQEPLIYQFTNGSESVAIHRSRIIFFPGAKTLEEDRDANQGWDDSVLQALNSALRSFMSAYASIDGMFADVSQSVFKIKGLIDALESAPEDQADLILSRFEIISALRSVHRAIFLSAGTDDSGDGDESFDVVERTTLAGLGDVTKLYYTRLATAVGWPLTVLCGSSPSGQDATGDNDLLLYLNGPVKALQDAIANGIISLVHLVHRELGLEGEPEEWSITWPEPWDPKPMDQATLEQMRLRSAVELITAKVAVPAQVGQSLASIAPNLGLKLDEATLLKLLPKQIDRLTEELDQPLPDPSGMNGTQNGAQGEKMTERATPSRAAEQQV